MRQSVAPPFRARVAQPVAMLRQQRPVRRGGRGGRSAGTDQTFRVALLAAAALALTGFATLSRPLPADARQDSVADLHAAYQRTSEGRTSAAAAVAAWGEKVEEEEEREDADEADGEGADGLGDGDAGDGGEAPALFGEPRGAVAAPAAVLRVSPPLAPKARQPPPPGPGRELKAEDDDAEDERLPQRQQQPLQQQRQEQRVRSRTAGPGGGAVTDVAKALGGTAADRASAGAAGARQRAAAADAGMAAHEEEQAEVAAQMEEIAHDREMRERAEMMEDEESPAEETKVENGKTFQKIGDEWVEVEEMDAKRMSAAERNGGRESGDAGFGRVKLSEVVKIAREAARDKEKLKDPETKKLLRQWKVNTKSPTAILDSIKQLQLQQRQQSLEKGKREELAQVDIKKKVLHPALLVPMARSRGTWGCGVCTNGTGGHFAKGIGATIGGGAYNVAWNENDGFASVAGGQNNQARGQYATIGGGYGNEALHDDSTVAGGGQNKAVDVATTVAGGELNTAFGGGSTVAGGANNMASGLDATVVGGIYNKASGDAATVGGGEYNVGSGLHSAVAGGVLNVATHDFCTAVGGMANTASGNYSVVAGGGYNHAARTYASVLGGYNNTASGEDATVTGGASNVASGAGAFVMGGGNNTASGRKSVAAGHLAHAAHAGSVVLADASPAPIKSTAPGQLTVQHVDVRKPGGGPWIAPSDRRAMTNTTRFVMGLEVLREVKPVSFQYERGPAKQFVGVVAQELESAGGGFMVSQDRTGPNGKLAPPGEGARAVDPNAFTYMLINAVTDLDRRVAKLERENAALRRRLASRR